MTEAVNSKVTISWKLSIGIEHYNSVKLYDIFGDDFHLLQWTKNHCDQIIQSWKPGSVWFMNESFLDELSF